MYNCFEFCINFKLLWAYCQIFNYNHIKFYCCFILTDPQPKFFSLASLAVLHLLFQNILLLLKVLKALDDIKIFRNITDGENKEICREVWITFCLVSKCSS
jgi:hypothetical protein